MTKERRVLGRPADPTSTGHIILFDWETTHFDTRRNERQTDWGIETEADRMFMMLLTEFAIDW